eukprot:354272-Chlamydomonas_euryale.AAC.1
MPRPASRSCCPRSFDADSLAKFAEPGFVMRLNGNRLFCCAASVSGSGGSLLYDGVNDSAPRLPSFLRFSTLKRIVSVDSELGGAEGVNLWGSMR